MPCRDSDPDLTACKASVLPLDYRAPESRLRATTFASYGTGWWPFLFVLAPPPVGERTGLPSFLTMVHLDRKNRRSNPGLQANPTRIPTYFD